MLKKKWGIIIALVTVIISIVIIYIHVEKKRDIVFVRNNKVLGYYYEKENIGNKLKEQSKELEGNLMILKQDIDSLTKINSKNPKKEISQLIELKQAQYEKVQNYSIEKIKKIDEDLRNSVAGRITEGVHKFGIERGYVLILGATDNGNIVYADSTADVTNEFMEWLKNEQK